MVTYLELQKMVTSEIEEVRELCNQLLNSRFSTEAMTWGRVLTKKSIENPQKFSPYFERELKRFAGLTTYGGSIYGIFDGENKDGKTIECKYATYNNERGASFPQMMRLDTIPDEYLIAIFYGNEIEIYNVPGDDMHSSVIRKKGTPAHANNHNQLRINIKKNSQEMNFLKGYRDSALETKLKSHIFGAP